MKIDVLTIFPKMLETMDLSIVGKAKAAGKLVLEGHDFREFAKNKQRHVDDYPYGGNTAGVRLTPRPGVDCVESRG
ncbi:MAG: tRNA (guanosine(37)-N1)-methyltransferase TrmD, partial [Streptococcaceae bacterium]|nr:tRNA (guanosine(37)-N1)-methyltransferase TrmD [Streptococcaceae bacterium]